MSKKPEKIFICSKCDAQTAKWSGRCLECGTWGSLSESLPTEAPMTRLRAAAVAETVGLSDVKEMDSHRLSSGLAEVDRVLGGGLVEGSIVLLSGEPGIGKSTVLAQICDAVGRSGHQVLYASGEESAAQVKGRFTRLACNLSNIVFSGDTDADRVAASILALRPALAVIDSVQTLRTADIASDPGGVAQIRAVTAKFMEVAKTNGIIIILVGHITKDGQVAGPKTLEHMVDTVIHLESETAHDYRLLRATKNRFGSVNELGVFEMTGQGFREVSDASAVFLDSSSPEFAGSAIGTALEGTRPFLVEVQTLVTRTVFGYPQRKASGYDLNRLQVLCSVIGKRAGANLANSDVIANVVGGFRITDPALDLAVCLAAISGLMDISVSRRVVAIGEVGLGGEVRRVSRMSERLAEAAKLGFEIVLVPQIEKAAKIKQVQIRDLNALLVFLKNN